MSRLEKKYNDLSVEYTDWKLIDTIKQVVRRPPILLRIDRETKKTKDYEPIVQNKSERVFDYLLLVIPIYKTVNRKETIGQRVTEKTYYRDNFYYSDGSIIYGNWKLGGISSYNDYY